MPNTPTWPWLKDAKLAESAIQLDGDARQPVAELLAEHSEGIVALRAVLQDDPLFDETKHDDLWLLRFVLSHKEKIPKAAKACQHTLKFRQLHQLDEKDIRLEIPFSMDNPKSRGVLEHVEKGAFGLDVPDPLKGPISYVCPGAIDQNELIVKVPDETYQTFVIYGTEWCHQWLDYVTRTTGLLTKMIRVVDLKGISTRRMNRNNMKRIGRVMNEMEDCYPQLLQTVFPCHAPAWFQGVWSTFRPILPKRVLTKFDFINPEHRMTDLEKLLRYVDAEHLPERFGGKNKDWPCKTTIPSP